MVQYFASAAGGFRNGSAVGYHRGGDASREIHGHQIRPGIVVMGMLGCAH
ncbi:MULTISPECIES: hypothetical protein [Kocuria]